MLGRISIHNRCYESRIKAIENWKVPSQTKRDVRRFLEELAIGKVNRGRRISESRQTKYLDLLVIPLSYFGKPVSRLTEKDLEKFERALSTDAIFSKFKGRPYAHATKVDIRKALKIFLRWRFGATKGMKLAGWLDTRDRAKTPEYLRVDEIQEILRNCRTIEQRYAVAVLFDSGARAEEFINIRLSDVQLPEGKGNYVKITLREEFSKTNGRTISLYWQESLEVVRALVRRRVGDGARPEDPVFPGTYDSLRMFLGRLGKAALGRSVHPHLFRHSSATYYATRLNRQELCYRYGWRFSSDMPDIYISRAGMESRELDEKFAGTEMSELKAELVALRQAEKLKDDRMAEFQRMLATIQQNLGGFAELVQLNPSAADLQAAIARKRKKSGTRGIKGIPEEGSHRQDLN